MNQIGRYLRRCHVCGATLEKDQHDMGSCDHCGKALAPFFYFDEKQIIGFGDRGEGPWAVAGIPSNHHYGPLIGIGLFWEDDYSRGR